MTRETPVLGISTSAILALLLTASYLPLYDLWGLNHPAFLSDAWLYAGAAVLLIVSWLSFGPAPEESVDRVLARVHDLLFERGPVIYFVIGTFAVGIFYVMRTETHLLGDGLTWLAVFGQGESFYPKWTELGSIYLLRVIQSLLGGYTEQTALTAFRILSISSGLVYIVAVFGIARLITEDHKLRLLTVTTLIVSGVSLLFCGYVEFYSLVWAAATAFFYFALRYLRGGSLVFPAVLLVVAVALHIEAVCLLPAAALLPVLRLEKGTGRKIAGAAVALAGVVAATGILLLYDAHLQVRAMILPLLNDWPFAPGYTVFSSAHFFDLLNLLFFAFPGTIPLLAFWAFGIRSTPRDKTSVFLAAAALGSAIFISLFAAAITMARDWDVMAFGLLAPMLLLLYLLTARPGRISARGTISYAIITVFTVSSLLAATTSERPSEERFYTLLNERNRSSWWLYANHFHLKGYDEQYQSIIREMKSRFPEYETLSQGYDILKLGDHERVMDIAERLVQFNPYESNFQQFKGNVFRSMKEYDSAEVYLKRAVKLQPYRPELLNELGHLYTDAGEYKKAVGVLTRAHSLARDRTYITEGLGLAHYHLGHYDSALALADTLFASDPDSPGGHLLYMVVAIGNGNLPDARQHFAEYLQHGSGRSDYDALLKHYRWLDHREGSQLSRERH